MICLQKENGRNCLSCFKPILLSIFLSVILGGQIWAQNEFITTWQTTTNNDFIYIPTFALSGETLNYTVDWGDGIVETNLTAEAVHIYEHAGTYTVKISGQLPRVRLGGSSPSADKLLSIEQWGNIAWTDMEFAFAGCPNLVSNATDAPDLSQVTNMVGMFYESSAFNSDISHWDFSTVENMVFMFYKASSFDQNLGSWDISNVINMASMLDSCGMSVENYDQTLISWASLGKIGVPLGAADLEYCEGEDARTTLQVIYGWGIRGDRKASDCVSPQAFITTWETTTANETITIPTFPGESYNYAIDFNNDGVFFPANTGDVSFTFPDAGIHTISIRGQFPRIYFNGAGDRLKIKSVEQWGEIAWTSMGNAFSGCENLSLNANDTPDLSNVLDLSSMFSGAIAVDHDFGGWNMSSITDMSNMLDACGMSVANYDQTLIGWESQGISNINLGALDLQYCDAILARSSLIDNYGWTIIGDQRAPNCISPTDFVTTWDPSNPGASCNTCITILTYPEETYNYDVDWNNDGIFDELGITGNITHDFGITGTQTIRIRGQFPGMYFDNASDPLKIISVDQWGNIAWTSMRAAFYGCENLNIYANDAPDLSNVTDMAGMFFRGGADLGDLSNWQVSNVTNMSFMFFEFNGAVGGLDNWDVSNVQNMEAMFGIANFNGDISGWDVSRVTNMKTMFARASSFDQNLGGWNISSVTTMVGMLDVCGMSVANYDQTLIGWENQGVSGITLGALDLQYCDAILARSSLIDNYGWTIIGDQRAPNCISPTDFVTTWDPSNPGASCNTCITILTYPEETYNYDVDWNNDGIFDELGITGNITHDFGITGTQTIRISGQFPGMYFDNASDPLKIISVDQWGNIAWTSMRAAFYGCENLNIYANDAPDLSNVTDMAGMFFRCGADLGDLSNWQVSSVTNMSFMFFEFNGAVGGLDNWDVSNVQNMEAMFGIANFNGDISGWDVSRVTNMKTMFARASIFDQNLGGWNISSVTTMVGMLDDCGMSVANYDQTLIGWENQGVSGIVLGAAGLQYCDGHFARKSLINNYGWDIQRDQIQQLSCDSDLFVTTWQTTTANESITIPTFDGETYNYTIDWGDGTLESNQTGNATHTYATAGTYTVIIGGQFPHIYFNNTADRLKIISVDQWGNIAWTSMRAAFYGCENLNIYANDAPDLSNVTDMAGMFFRGGADLGDLSNWQVSSVTNMSFMFFEFNGAVGGLDNWDVSNVQNMEAMFGIANFNGDISGWDVSRVTNMKTMFARASTFDQNLGGWDISSETNMLGMLDDCGMSVANYDQTLIGWESQGVSGLSLGAAGLQYCDGHFARESLINNYGWDIQRDQIQQLSCDPLAFITTWRTLDPNEPITIPTFSGETYNYSIDWGDGTVEFNQTGNATHTYASAGTYTVMVSGQFPRIYFGDGGNSYKLMTIEQWGDNPWTSMGYAFTSCFNLTSNATDRPDLSNVTDMQSMFSGAKSFNGDLSQWEVGNVANMSNMFSGASAFNSDLSNWDVSKVSDMSSMFNKAASFDQNLGGWNISSINNMSKMLDNASLSVANYDQTLIGWESQDVAGITLGALDLQYCEAYTARESLINNYGWSIAGDQAEQPICNFRPFVTTWQTTTANESITIPTNPAETYNYAIDWDGDGIYDQAGITGDITHTYPNAGTHTIHIRGQFPQIFFRLGSDNDKIISIDQWGDIAWTSMRAAFYRCTNLTYNAADAPDLSNVLDMTIMFEGASSFNGDLSTWDVSNVTLMTGMFHGATAFNSDLHNWNTSNVTEMIGMFFDASNFDQDLSAWTISPGIDMYEMLSNSGLSIENYDKTLIGWASQGISGIGLGAQGLQYCEAENERNTLINTYNWTITGDQKDPLCTQPPTAICQNITVDADANCQGTALAADFDGGSTDPRGETLGFSLDNEGPFPLGTTDVILTVTNESGFTAQCSASITVEDNTPPTAICQGVSVPVDANGMATVFPADVDNGSFDACGPVSFSFGTDNEGNEITQIDFTCDALTSTLVLLTVTDQANNQSTCLASIGGIDNMPPVMSCKDITVELDANGNGEYSTFDLNDGSTDNCGLAQIGVVAIPVNCDNIGTFSATLELEDAAGNSASCTGQVTVVDNLPPVISCPIDGVRNSADGQTFYTIQGTELDATFSDNCAGASITNDYNNATTLAGELLPVGIHAITWTATDASGNVNICTVNIEVQQTCNASITNVAMTNPSDCGMNDGTIVITATGVNLEYSINGGTDFQGSNSFSDLGGGMYDIVIREVNATTCTATSSATLNAPMAPSITDVAITNPTDCGVNDGTIVITATGVNLEYSIDGGNSFQSSNSFTDLAEGNYEIVVREVAATNCFATGNASLTTVDNTPPIAICQDITVALDENGVGTVFPEDIDNGSYDACGAVRLSFNGVTQIDFSCASGGRGIILKVTDEAGNESTCLGGASPVDEIPPTAICQDITVALDENGEGVYSLAQLNNGSTDNCSLEPISDALIPVSCSNLGAFSVILDLEDHAGNTANCTAQVTVVDNLNPIISCKADGQRDTDDGQASYTVQGTEFDATFTDNCAGGSITNDYNNAATLAGEQLSGGTHVITWTATDASGNIAECSTTITVDYTESAYFITTWQTTNANESITIPTNSNETYDYTINWGDGEVEFNQTGDATHTYANAGTYTVRIAGQFPRIYFNSGGDKDKIMTIEQWGDIVWTSMSGAFAGCSNLNITNPQIDTPDLSNVTDMRFMFHNATSFNGDIGDWDVSNVQIMHSLFRGASVFNQDIGGWNVASVLDMRNTFFGASSFNQDIGDWKVENVTDMLKMFYEARAFNQDISRWKTGNVERMELMFYFATSFNQPIGSWNVENVHNMRAMFEGSHFNQDIGSWNVGKVENLSSMFRFNSSFNQDLSQWKPESATNMARMFEGATSFDQNIGSWDVENVTNMNLMFSGAGLSIQNYDALLIGWSSQQVQPNVVFDAGNSQFCAGADAKNILESAPNNWTITDAGTGNLIEAVNILTTSQCDPWTNTYSQMLEVIYDHEINTGSLMLNGETFAITGSPQVVELTGLVSDGQAVDINVYWSEYAGCSFEIANAFTAPADCSVPCDIINVTSGEPYNCDPNSDTYQRDITIEYAGTNLTGNLMVSLDGAAPVAYTLTYQSPQVITLSDLPSNNKWVDIETYISEAANCSWVDDKFFKNPKNCGSTPSGDCDISALAIGEQNCDVDNGTYTQDLILTYTDAPSNGTILVKVNNANEWIGFPITGSPQVLTLEDLTPGTGNVDIFVKFSDDNGCTFYASNVFTAPEECVIPCAITSIATGTQTACDPQTNTYSQELMILYEHAPNSGELMVNGQSFEITESPQIITLTNLVSDGNPVNVTAYFSANSTCELSESGLFTAPAACGAPPSGDGEVLFVTKNNNLNDGDLGVKSRLESLGYTVEVQGQNAVQSSDADGKSLVLISNTVSAGAINTTFTAVAVPVVSYESQLYDDLGMTGSSNGSDFGQDSNEKTMDIDNDTHTMAAGLSGEPKIFNSNGNIIWGSPNDNAIKVASTQGNYPNQWGIFGYETGTSMVSGIAPARRAGLFFKASDVSKLNDNGWALFDAVICWATGCGSARFAPEVNPEVAITAFPNPFLHNLTIEWNYHAQEVRLILRNLLGQEVINQEIWLENTYQLNTSNLPEGMYILQIIGDGFKQEVKVVKE